jgi:hypothetical protein
MEWIKHKSSLIDKLTLSRFIDPFEFQVLKGYYEDKRTGCSLEDCIMSLKSKATSKRLFHSLDQAKGTGTCYNLSFIDMYDMDKREVIHNLEAYLAHRHGTWVYTFFAAEDV